jgi:AcrR family transcriptional regulator
MVGNCLAGDGSSTTTSGSLESVNLDRILATAARLFRLKGYAASTTRELANLLGIQRASLYYHVSSKEEILYELMRRALEDAHRRAEAAAVLPGPAIDRLYNLALGHLELLLTERDKFAVMLIELRALRGTRGEAILKLRDDYEHRIRHLVADGQREGSIRKDYSAPELARTFLGTINYPAFWFDPSGPASPAEVARMVTNVAIAGIAAPSSKGVATGAVVEHRQERKYGASL